MTMRRKLWIRKSESRDCSLRSRRLRKGRESWSKRRGKKRIKRRF